MKAIPLHSLDRSQLRRGSFLIALGGRLALPLFFLGAALLVQPCRATPFQWEYTGSLQDALGEAPATLLSDGKVLVVVANAELYYPATGTWTYTGSLNTARWDHTDTLLTDGRVLVAGGDGCAYSCTIASAELYDPATGNWTYTGSLNTGRYWHTETLLTDGRVLVAGGANNFVTLASAEIYDPATGTWTYTGSLNEAREFHRATLLPDGRVLVAGGGFGFELASAEIYDPATGAWTYTGSLNDARTRHTATLLANGEVLVAGGIGGSSTLASAELYDPATGTWTFTGSLNTARIDFTATLLSNGEVLAAAGGPVPLASAELYDPGIIATKVHGRGTVDNQGNEVTFRFRAVQADDSSKLGQFTFCDPAAGVCTTNARIQSLSITGNTASFSGQARLDGGTRVTFSVSVTDNGQPGTLDTISISLSNGYSVSGNLISGDIRMQ